MKLNHLIIIGALCGALLLPSSASSWGVVGLSAGAGGGELTCTDGSGDSAIVTQDTGSLYTAVSDVQWRSQQFHFDVATRITSIHLIIVDSENAGSLVLGIRADNGSNLPTGSDLADTTVTIAASNIAQNADGVSVKFVLPEPFEPTIGTLYHIVVRATGTGPLFYWKYYDSNVYDDGQVAYSTDSGSSWTAVSASERRFIINGCQ